MLLTHWSNRKDTRSECKSEMFVAWFVCLVWSWLACPYPSQCGMCCMVFLIFACICFIRWCACGVLRIIVLFSDSATECFFPVRIIFFRLTRLSWIHQGIIYSPLCCLSSSCVSLTQFNYFFRHQGIRGGRLLLEASVGNVSSLSAASQHCVFGSVC